MLEQCLNIKIKTIQLITNQQISNAVTFAFEMKPARIAGLAMLALLWVWLSVGLLTSANGFNLKNILIAAMSGIIIFVPLYKKYVKGDKK